MRREQKVFEAAEREKLPLAEEEEAASRIVEGTVVDSTLLSGGGAFCSDTSGASLRHSIWRRQGLVVAWLVWTLFLVLALVADKDPGLLGPIAPLIPGLGPSATVAILPAQSTLSTTLTVPTTALPDVAHPEEVQMRVVSVTSAPLTQTAQARGTGHTEARQARGTLTFYNAATYVQTVAEGTTLTGADGVQVVTDAPALLPAGNPPLFGIVTVPAHAVEAGPQGNIAVLDLNGLCCLSGVAVKNTTAFTGGKAARDYPLVRQEDIDRVVARLTTALLPQAQATLQAEMHDNERLVDPLECRPGVQTDHAAGDEAASVTITVEVSCRAEVYDQETVEWIASDRLTERAERILGPGYALLGRVTTEVNLVKGPQARQGSLSLLVRATGIWVYQFSEARLHQLAMLVPGKDLLQAQVLLMRQRGVQSASLALVGGGTTLPRDPHQIRVIVLSVQGADDRQP